MRVLLAGTARGLGLMERMPARFRARGWPLDDRMHVATAAVCCVALRVGKTRFKVFPGTDDPRCWSELVGLNEAQKIVETLELQDMLKPDAPGVFVPGGAATGAVQ